MKLKKVLRNITYKSIRGSKEVEITGICGESKCVAPGNLFIARKGHTYDGSDFIMEAVDAGAVAVVTDMYDPFLKNVTQVIHDDVGSIEAGIAASYYKYPSKYLLTIGVTGTNGKTSTCYLIKHILDSSNKNCGLISTIENVIGTHRFFSTRTTPDCITNQKLLREMVMYKTTSAVLEVSSHGLDQERVKNIEFDIAVFTNLTAEHLDYHGTMENYLKAKMKLFSSLKNVDKRTKKVAVINIDSPYASQIIESTSADIITYGIEKKADVQATSFSFSPRGTIFTLQNEGQEMEFFSPLIGKHNIYNLLASIATGITFSIPLEDMKNYIATFKKIEGRLERVSEGKNYHVFVDFAHTEEGLRNVLLTLNEVKKGRIITLFGCGGDRDRQKREKMGKVSSLLSDFTIITTDNPRGEDAGEIARQIACGFSDSSRYTTELDRKSAIEKAIELAQKDDIVLIAGKGHERFQIFANKTSSFDDRKVTREIIKRRG